MPSLPNLLDSFFVRWGEPLPPPLAEDLAEVVCPLNESVNERTTGSLSSSPVSGAGVAWRIFGVFIPVGCSSDSLMDLTGLYLAWIPVGSLALPSADWLASA